MNHAVILAQPKPRSFIRLLAETYVEAVRERGHGADLIDLYAIDFDPRLQLAEIPGADGARPTCTWTRGCASAWPSCPA